MTVVQSSFIQLQGVTYDSAIDHYKNLRARFYQDYAKVSGQLEQDVINDIEKQLITEIANENLEMQSNEMTNELYNDIIEVVKMRFEQGDASLIKQRAEARKKYYYSAKKKALLEAQELGQDIFSDEELKSYIINQLRIKGVNQGFSINDILAQAKSYRNKIIASRSKERKKRINTTKGYYKEAIVYKAFNQLAEHLQQQLNVMHTGDKKVGGKDTAYDLYLNFGKPLEDLDFQQIVTEELDVGYGIQVKSWIAPWESDKLSYFNKKYGFSIGSRANLLKESGLDEKSSNLYTWIKGILFLEKKAIQVLGQQQLGYTTGKGFYWTCDLISQFRNLQYFLAFGYRSQKPLSSSVSWVNVNQFKY